ncbi:hypothetical protein QFC19_007969 [Naganishia cerealis]|uniref:Uncharacterized protein n=1 Tax=Naganishia cerealis TaxID=610337 RepID=A0ACC2V6T6_9TREE|nr:hypothetical protein QFC19_007969 [Naganishia cerealis]
MPAWYDVENMGRDRLADSIEDDEKSMMQSVAVVDSLIEKEIEEQNISEGRIVIGGFSQGCVVTTLSSLILKRKLAGLIALSGWLALSHKIEELISPTAKELAVFWGHGKQDRVIEHRYGRQSCFLLRTLENVKLPSVPAGTPFAKPGLRFETYEGMNHSLGDQEIRDISEWLGYALPA